MCAAQLLFQFIVSKSHIESNQTFPILNSFIGYLLVYKILFLCICLRNERGFTYVERSLYFLSSIGKYVTITFLNIYPVIRFKTLKINCYS